ncbi:MAG: hypothetical protein ACOX6X_03705 [Dethiobacteria bacterium]|jgi:hypothetical protein
MIFNKRKKIDKTLRCFFQEEAASVVPPSSQKLWDDLKGRLANKENLSLPVPGKPGKDPGSYSLVKNKPLLAMVVASFVLIVFFARVPPAPSLQQFVLNLFTATPAREQLAEYEDIDTGDNSGNGAPFSTITTGEGLQQQQETRIMMAEEEKTPLAGSNKAAQKDMMKAETEGITENEENIVFKNEHFSVQTTKEKLAWDKQSDFVLALDKLKDLAPEKIWIINEPPEGFSFLEGSVVKTENFLFQITHQYINEEGNILTLTQDFFLDKKEIESFPLVGNGVADPKQVGPFSGLLFRQEDGVIILTWKKESSIVTLSGQIEEKLLLSIPNSLKTG